MRYSIAVVSAALLAVAAPVSAQGERGVAKAILEGMDVQPGSAVDAESFVQGLSGVFGVTSEEITAAAVAHEASVGGVDTFRDGAGNLPPGLRVVKLVHVAQADETGAILQIREVHDHRVGRRVFHGFIDFRVVLSRDPETHAWRVVERKVVAEG